MLDYNWHSKAPSKISLSSTEKTSYTIHKFGSDHSRIAGKWVKDDLGIDNINNEASIDAKDGGIVLTKKSNDHWKVVTQSTRSTSHQWLGWKLASLANQTIKVSFDIKFEKKPSTTGAPDSGMKVFDIMHSDWIQKAPLNDWYHVDIDQTLPATGDTYHIILIFENLHTIYEIKNYQIIMPEPNPYWKGSLSNRMRISRIKFFKTAGMNERFSNFTLKVWDGSNVVQNKTSCAFTEEGDENVVIDAVGNEFLFELPGSDRYLNLDERSSGDSIEVYGYEV